MVIPMTTNLFPLPYWAPTFQRVPLFLRPLGETYALKERRRARELSQKSRFGAEDMDGQKPSPDMFRGSSQAMTRQFWR